MLPINSAHCDWLSPPAPRRARRQHPSFAAPPPLSAGMKAGSAGGRRRSFEPGTIQAGLGSVGAAVRPIERGRRGALAAPRVTPGAAFSTRGAEARPRPVTGWPHGENRPPKSRPERRDIALALSRRGQMAAAVVMAAPLVPGGAY